MRKWVTGDAVKFLQILASDLCVTCHKYSKYLCVKKTIDHYGHFRFYKAAICKDLGSSLTIGAQESQPMLSSGEVSLS